MNADAQETSPGERWGPRRILPCLAIAAALPYLGVLDAPFVFDDVKLVKENRFLREAASDPALLVATFDITSRRWETEELRPNYRPLRFLSYVVDYKLSEWWYGDFPPADPPPFFFHLSNLLFHVLNTLLVGAIAVALLQQLLPRRGDPVAGLAGGDPERAAWFGGLSAGLLFAVHPLQTEAVTYISGRRDVLSTCFFLIAVWLLVRERPRARPGWWTLLGVPLCLVAGLLSKEMVITLAPALLLVDWLRGARWSYRRFVLHGVLWTLTLGFVAITLRGEGLIAPTPVAEGDVAFLTACRYALRYLGLVLLPISQTVDYSYNVIPPSTGMLSPWTTLPAVLLAGGLVLGGVTLLVARGRRASGWRALAGLLALGVLWFSGTLVPVLQFVPIAERFAERFAYLPGIGLLLLGAGLLQQLWSRERLFGWAVLIAVSVVCLVAAVRRNEDWKSPLRLWTAAVEVGPGCARAHFGRAHALKAAGRPGEAAEEYTRALDIFRERPEISLHHGYILQALTLRGALYGQLGREAPEFLEHAVRDYREVLASKDTDGRPIAGSPRHTAVQFDLAQFLLLAGKRPAAALEYERVIDIGTPHSLVGAAHYYLGKIALGENQLEKARGDFQLAYDVLPDHAPEKYRLAAELADLHLDTKDLDAAARLVDDALRRVAGGPEELHLLLRRAKIADRRGDLSGTIEILREILEKDADYVPALVALAGIEANLGEVESAEKRYRRALERQPGHRGANKGLKMLMLRAQVGEKAPEEATRERLVAMAGKGLGHLEKVELTAARDVFATLFDEAKRSGEKEYQAVALRGLGGVEGRFGRVVEARKYFEAALELEPGNAATLLRLGDIVLRRFAEKDAARDYYLRYLDALKEGEKPQPRVYVNLAELTMEGSAAAALEYCRAARQLGFEAPALERTLGYVHAELGEWDASLDAFNRYLDRERDEKKRQEVRRFIKESVLPNL